MNCIETKSLCKNYGEKSILNHVNLGVKSGEVMGLLGANGAGKTTLLKLLCGLLEPTNGDIAVFSQNPREKHDRVLSELGVLIETPVFYTHLTARENLAIHLAYMGKQADIEKILARVGLGTVNNPVSKFSLGMKQKLAIARCISHRPKVLLLDEPINGLDPAAIKEVRALFLELKKEGTTILLSSHILSEVLLTCERLVVLSNGNLENLGSIQTLQETHKDNLENYLIERM